MPVRIAFARQLARSINHQTPSVRNRPTSLCKDEFARFAMTTTRWPRAHSTRDIRAEVTRAKNCLSAFLVP